MRLFLSVAAGPGLLLVWSTPAQAVNVRLGQSYFEQGDYLLHPGVQVALENARRQSLGLEFTGRTFGRFTEATGILSLKQPLDILPWSFVRTSYGLSLMDEYTAYDDPQGADKSLHALNLGLNFGIAWKLWEGRRWDARLEWNSHLFAAGLAFIYLTTARKTVFTAAFGYDL